MDHRFDMTDPFAQVKQRVARAEALTQQMPPAQRRALIEAMQTPTATPTQPCTQGQVTMTSVPVPGWDGGRDVMPRSGTPGPIRRPRQRVATDAAALALAGESRTPAASIASAVATPVTATEA